jgi:hypothetical protein
MRRQRQCVLESLCHADTQVMTPFFGQGNSLDSCSNHDAAVSCIVRDAVPSEWDSRHSAGAALIDTQGTFHGSVRARVRRSRTRALFVLTCCAIATWPLACSEGDLTNPSRREAVTQRPTAGRGSANAGQPAAGCAICAGSTTPRAGSSGVAGQNPPPAGSRAAAGTGVAGSGAVAGEAAAGGAGGACEAQTCPDTCSGLERPCCKSNGTCGCRLLIGCD